MAERESRAFVWPAGSSGEMKAGPELELELELELGLGQEGEENAERVAIEGRSRRNSGEF